MENHSSGLPVWLLLLGALGAIVGFCWSEQDYVAASVLGAISLSGMWGYLFGGLRILGYFGSLTAAYAIADPLGARLLPTVQAKFATSADIALWISRGAAGFAAFLVASLVLSILARLIVKRWPEVDGTNRLLGFGLGGVQGCLASLVFLSGLLAVEPLAERRLKEAARHSETSPLATSIARQVVDVAQQTRRSTVGPLVTRYSLFAQSSQWKSLEHSAQVLSNPRDLEMLLKTPAVKQMQNDPEIRAALESLAQDPEIRRIAQSQQPVDHETALSLLNHPGIAQLLQQPKLMETLAEAMQQAPPK